MSPVQAFFTREFKAQRNLSLSWLVPLSAMMGLYSSLQPRVAGDSGLLAAKLAMLPPAMKQAFSLGETDFNRPVGYLATNFLIVTLGASLFAGLLGANVASREDTQRTSESMLTLPVTRWQLLLGKLLAAIAWLAIAHVTIGTVTFLALSQVATSPVEGELVASMFAGTFLVGLCFVASGFLLAVLVRQARTAPNLNLGLVLGTYFLGVVAKVTPAVAQLGLLSPYRLVEPAEVVKQAGLSIEAGGLVLVTGVVLGLAFFWYERRDVHA